ncbi:FadR/GntR family transcriptional regulator [Ottowia thiooxydans]|uniref:FadR/GntR family transcriptional regulator n=1 Tax=Ottowia thiooxydans TaxID=219182 RepID=UPI000683D6CD|nr:FCD domain-containing protein [Ottowia thiooxydans]
MNIRRRSHDAAEALRQYILVRLNSGELRKGDQLPTEREMTELFGSSRATVRRTLALLETEGILAREVGRGTFVRSLPIGTAPSGADTGSHVPMLKELAGLPRLASPTDVMDLRLVLEPAVIAEAVLRASPADLEEMDKCLDRAKRAATLEEFEHWDDMLHRSFAAASRNPMYIAIYALIGSVRLEAQWGELKKRTLTDQLKEAHFQEHVTIVEAVRRRDGVEAAKLMFDHLSHIRYNMFGRQLPWHSSEPGSQKTHRNLNKSVGS